MTVLRRVALVSDDLMFRSQLELAVRTAGGELLVGRDDDVPDAPTVFVDLNARSPQRLGAIATLRQQRPGATIIAFCHHEERELRQMAMTVGADQCLTNGALQAAALRLAGIPAASGERVE